LGGKATNPKQPLSFLSNTSIEKPLHLFPSLPMNLREESPTMQVSVDVTDDMRREAEARGLPIIDYIEFLIDKGRKSLGEGATLSNAMERIRALSSKSTASKS
jgi:hypothetical protein